MFLIRWLGLTALLLVLAVGIEELRLARAQKQTAEAREKVAELKTAIADQNAGVDRLAAVAPTSMPTCRCCAPCATVPSGAPRSSGPVTAPRR